MSVGLAFPDGRQEDGGQDLRAASCKSRKADPDETHEWQETEKNKSR